MTALTNHVWGVWRAADRVWAEVVGLGSAAEGHVLAVWQAYMDESDRTDGDGYFVIGGCVATAAQWAEFAKDWEQLLPRFGRVDEKGRYFHMTEMAKWAGGELSNWEDVQVFYRAMERHVPVYVSARFRKSDYRRALSRIWVRGAVIDWVSSLYFVAFRCLMDTFHGRRDQMAEVLPADAQVDFYFDEHRDKRIVRAVWDEYLENRPASVRHLYGAEPRFDSDRRLLPLQAADFWAWWVRYWADSGSPEKIGKQDFGYFKRKGGLGFPAMTVDIAFSEDQFMPFLERAARRQLPDREVVVFPMRPVIF